jgi:regulator of cell morphogenesis and NO signaling
MVPGKKQPTISEIVKRDYRTADVFKKFGVNYCCGGNSTVEEVCNLQNINQNSLSDSLDSATKTLVIPPWLRFDEWSVDFLVDYIINVHHAYLKQMLPSLEVQLLSFVNNHRKKHPFLDDVNNTFNTLSSFLMEHTQDEEEKLFPYIKQIYSAYKKKKSMVVCL